MGELRIADLNHSINILFNIGSSLNLVCDSVENTFNFDKFH